jgi:hypothetical protein
LQFSPARFAIRLQDIRSEFPIGPPREVGNTSRELEVSLNALNLAIKSIGRGMNRSSLVFVTKSNSGFAQTCSVPSIKSMSSQ